jgi:predicted PurR-regulated permease PerM
MITADETASNKAEKRFLWYLLVAATGALMYILLPFYGAIMWGTIIATLFSPMYHRLLPKCRGCPTLAAFVTLLIVVVIVIFPLAFIATSLVHEASQAYQRLQSGEFKPALYLHGVFDALPTWITTLLDRFGLADFDILQRRVTALLTQATHFIATQALSIGQNTFEFIASAFITLYLAFFLIRDGDTVALALGRAIPLKPLHKQELIEKFITVIRATVKGNLLVSAIQGASGGLAFWFLGVSGALLWAVLMAFLSLVPAVGSALVWLPVSLYFLATGALWQGIALLAYGVLIIGLVDNLLRPMLVGKDTRMPDYIVMITTLGGIAVFGINGLVMGPVIAAMFMAVWHIFVTQQKQHTY